MDEMSIELGPFEPTWESLRQYQCPQWFRDAKLGIWSHWGPQAFPRHGDWYARDMYIEGSDPYRYHIRHFGHPSRFGWKDVCRLWKAEKFDPEALMDLFVAAGAKYFMAQAVHHDNFHNWDSQHHRWNSVKMGPCKDIVALWREAAIKRGLPFGVSEHLGASFSWYKPTKGADKTGPYAGIPYDACDPEYEDFYWHNQDAADVKVEWYTSDPGFQAKWYATIKELIDLYHPDLLYSDGGVPFGDYGLMIISHLYNTSARINGVNQAVYNQKDTAPGVYPVGVLDIERSQQPGIFPDPWQTDTSLGAWFYNATEPYKTPKQVVDMLIDIVSKNGNLLMNIPQLPDGSLDEECLYILNSMATWIKINGEGIYGTRPWTTFQEGPSQVLIQGYREDPVQWTTEDFRFTQKDGKVYAFQLKWPEGGKTVICSLGSGKAAPIKEVTLLGSQEPVNFQQGGRGLAIDLPEKKPCEYDACFRVSFE